VDARLERRIRRRKRPQQARALATAEALLDATLQVLVRDGYSRLTTTRVAERAGVSVGSLYQYFPDKRSLVTALKVRYFGLMVSAVEDALRGAGEGRAVDDVEGALRLGLGALVRVKAENLALTKALREPMLEASGVGFVRESLARFVATLLPLVRHVHRATNVDDEVALRRATLLVAALEGAISHAVFEAPDWLRAPWFLDELVGLGVGYLTRGAP
jgi:AcrR family transcriptional regulator